MSTYDVLGNLDPTPQPRSRSGPFSPASDFKSVADALAFCETRGLDPAEVSLAHNWLRWEDVETPEEVALRISHSQRSRRTHLEAVRKMYQEYVARGLYDEAAS